MPWAYISTFTGIGTLPSPMGAAVSSSTTYPAGTLLVLWSGGSEGGPLTSFTYDIPGGFASPSAAVPVQPAQVGGLTSKNTPSAVYADGQFFIFWQDVESGATYSSALAAPNPTPAKGFQEVATKDGPVVTYLADPDTIVEVDNGDSDLQFWAYSIRVDLGWDVDGSNHPSLASGFDGPSSPALAATPDRRISIVGTVAGQQMYYTSADAFFRFFLMAAVVEQGGTAPTTADRPALACWVPSANDGGGSPVLVNVFPSDGKLWYMEALYSAAGVTWQTRAPVPVDIILRNASPSGQAVSLKNPMATFATSPEFSDTVFMLIADREDQDTMYLVRYTGPDAPLPQPSA